MRAQSDQSTDSGPEPCEFVAVSELRVDRAYSDDLINSFHLHGNFFEYYPTGTRLQSAEYTDTVVLGQGQRGICELRFPHIGRYMFHAHKTEFADLGWMGFFEVVE